ncbi:MAG: hypothetical protein ABH832_00420 [bacterium]
MNTECQGSIQARATEKYPYNKKTREELKSAQESLPSVGEVDTPIGAGLNKIIERDVESALRTGSVYSMELAAEKIRQGLEIAEQVGLPIEPDGEKLHRHLEQRFKETATEALDFQIKSGARCLVNFPQLVIVYRKQLEKRQVGLDSSSPAEQGSTAVKMTPKHLEQFDENVREALADAPDKVIEQVDSCLQRGKLEMIRYYLNTLNQIKVVADNYKEQYDEEDIKEKIRKVLREGSEQAVKKALAEITRLMEGGYQALVDSTEGGISEFVAILKGYEIELPPSLQDGDIENKVTKAKADGIKKGIDKVTDKAINCVKFGYPQNLESGVKELEKLLELGEQLGVDTPEEAEILNQIIEGATVVFVDGLQNIVKFALVNLKRGNFDSFGQNPIERAHQQIDKMFEFAGSLSTKIPNTLTAEIWHDTIDEAVLDVIPH